MAGSPPLFAELTDPRTGAARQPCRLARQADIDAVVARSCRAAPAWAELAPRERAARLIALADNMDGAARAYVAAEQAGTGKPAHEASEEVRTAADVFRFYAGACRADLAPAGGMRVPRHESWVRWEPVGVVGAIVPWNYPLLMTAWRCAPALAAGNTVVLKPAETTPDSAELLARHAADVLGDDVLTVVTGDRDTGACLVGADIDMVAFTGSRAGGEHVSRAAGIRRTSLELGGNGPAIVLPDAPANTFDALAQAVTYNAGQSCAAPARVITTDAAYERVAEGLAQALSARTAGRHFGPLNNPDQLDRFDRLVGKTEAEWVVQGRVDVAEAESGGYWRAATLLAGVAPDAPVVCEEVFGPVLTLQSVASLDDAITLANSVPEGLAGSVWSRDVAAALTVAGRLKVGEAWVNCHLVQTAELPHGGRGASGHGTDLSVLALAEYQRPKTVTVFVGE